MLARVITITWLPRSVAAAQRCVATGAEFGVEVGFHPATTPRDDPRRTFLERKWPVANFDPSKYSKPETTMATFLSHYGLWEIAADSGEPMLVLEHDAVFVAPLPDLSQVKLSCTLAKPAFGAVPETKVGFGPLAQRWYYAGAHGYYVTHEGAKRFLDKAHEAQPVDVYLNRKRFPFLQEFYPWPIECDDSFTTIQNEVGAAPHHNKIEILGRWWE